MWTHPAALTFTLVIALLGLFQLALAVGAPYGRLAWGGGHERLPPGFRIGSLVSIAIYAGFAAIVLERAQLVAVFPWPEVARSGIWVIVGYMALGIFMNAISRSRPERFVMTPVVVLLFATSLVVALGV